MELYNQVPADTISAVSVRDGTAPRRAADKKDGVWCWLILESMDTSWEQTGLYMCLGAVALWRT